jgi:hypothetical protein
MTQLSYTVVLLRPFGLVQVALWPGLLAEFTELKFSLNFTRVNGSLRRKHNHVDTQGWAAFDLWWQ